MNLANSEAYCERAMGLMKFISGVFYCILQPHVINSCNEN